MSATAGRVESVFGFALAPAFAFASAFGFAIVPACVSPAVRVDEPSIPGSDSIRLELFYAVEVPEDAGERVLGRSLFGSLEGAAPEGEVFVISDGEGRALARGAADAFGRVTLGMDVRAGEVVRVSREGEGAPDAPIAFRVRDPSEARREAVRPPIEGAGSVPNDLVIVGAPERARGVLVRSGDNAVSTFDLERGLDAGGAGVRLPDVDGPFGPRPANPWFAVPLDNAGTEVAVTASGQHHVYLVDLERGVVSRTLEIEREVVLSSPLQLPRPVDVDGDGVLESEVTRFLPRAPQAVAVLGRSLVVAFTNFLSPRLDASRGPVYLPGVLAVWALDDLGRGPEVRVLSCFDPQELRPHGEGEVLVVCSGVLDPKGGAVVSTTPGAVLVFDLARKDVVDRFELDDFAPATALIASNSDGAGSGALWVGSLARGVVRRIDLEDRAHITDIVLNDEAIDSVFRLLELPGGLIAVPSFDTDKLHIIDARRIELSPAPFFGALEVGPGRPIFDGLQIIARRPGRSGVDFTGPDLFALGGIASRVTPIELRKVLGP